MPCYRWHEENLVSGDSRPPPQTVSGIDQFVPSNSIRTLHSRQEHLSTIHGKTQKTRGVMVRDGLRRTELQGMRYRNSARLPVSRFVRVINRCGLYGPSHLHVRVMIDPVRRVRAPTIIPGTTIPDGRRRFFISLPAAGGGIAVSYTRLLPHKAPSGVGRAATPP